jgi:hypothetical protein
MAQSLALRQRVLDIYRARLASGKSKRGGSTLEKLLSLTAMKRVVLPLISGVLIPPVYAGLVLIIVSVVTLITTSAPFDSKWYWLLCLPLEWSGHLYNHFFPAEAEKNLGELRVQVFLINLISDFLVSYVLTYLFLWFRQMRRPVLLSGPTPVRTDEAQISV